MTFLSIISYSGTIVFALSGALKGRTVKMDIFGGLVLAFVTAYGGGTLRDLLIGIKPVNWVNDNVALLLVFGAAIAAFVLKSNINRLQKTIFLADALGLGFFTAWGIEVALQHQLNNGYALVMGVITATFGGLLADILCNSVPALLKKEELYASACAIGGTVYLLLKNVSLEYTTSLCICILVVAGIRIYSKRKRLSLPQM